MHSLLSAAAAAAAAGPPTTLQQPACTHYSLLLLLLDHPPLCNSLPEDVQSASPLATFDQKLKIHLFMQSYLDIIL